MDETPIILIEPAPPTAEQLRGERERLERAFLNACRRRRPDLAWHIRRDEAAQRD